MWNDPRGFNITFEDFGVPRKTIDPLLNTGSPAIQDTDHGRSVLKRHIHNLADLLSASEGKRPTVDREVLREDVDHTPMNRTVSGHNTISEEVVLIHVKVLTPVGDEHIKLFETIRIQQQFDTFPSGKLALFVLGGDFLLATSLTSLLTFLDQTFNFLCLNATHSIFRFSVL